MTVLGEAREFTGVISYAAGPRLASSTAEPWDPESFRLDGLASFMRRCFGVVTHAG